MKRFFKFDLRNVGSCRWEQMRRTRRLSSPGLKLLRSAMNTPHFDLAGCTPKSTDGQRGGRNFSFAGICARSPQKLHPRGASSSRDENTAPRNSHRDLFCADCLRPWADCVCFDELFSSHPSSLLGQHRRGSRTNRIIAASVFFLLAGYVFWLMAMEASR
jgi:hypothetical protein